MPQILVVEDDAWIRLWIEDALQDAGYPVMFAGNADEAVSILNSMSSFDYVITDIEMPGSMNGIRLAMLIRDRWPPIRIIIASGKHRPTANDLPAGAIFLAKPYREADLVAALDQAR